MSRFELAVVAAMAAITLAIRYSFFALKPEAAFPDWVGRVLAYLPVAVLTAIVVPMVLIPDGQHWALTWRNEWLLGALASGVIAWRGGRLLLAIIVGFVVFFGWRWVVAWSVGAA
jgi:branched-subunit amino acid transport protein